MEAFDIFLRLAVAALVGAVLGLNRDLRGKPTGVLAIGLVGLASAAVVLALDLMSKRGFRHLPVMEGGKLYGIVSIRDLYRNVKEQMDDDILMLAETLIQG